MNISLIVTIVILTVYLLFHNFVQTIVWWIAVIALGYHVAILIGMIPSGLVSQTLASIPI